ncbi:MAG: protein translocase subunit SecD [Candidatus Vogelbacteria bacterium CG10_big_fil_rev_8_21_14_0_10_49_38]|uniref:Protein translocase subunit SecD n=1 Tax=Candidatus Vogelbacteria bacterium CG10_big_fil_rev_8_21_14_0_10_49_38 TaxID=1975043 RepID=A0A2H0RHR9_9BACT|nr:MAG: protein-export membrane protein SecD [bacterium CG10_49_38]PIR45976.1 MAG: protein translocase subunit SecD [Candidatus Vogelbacteria bacterium CG10_big_fil_rev_8_21_14_0_10_49_38]
MVKIRFWAIILLLAGLAVGWFDYASQIDSGSDLSRPFKLGLDLSGGSRLIYEADVSSLDPGTVTDAMASLREVIERRVNVFGVSEPIVQTERSALSGTEQHRLVVELPGVTDIKEASAMIAATPQLEFMVVDKTGSLDVTTTGEEVDLVATGLTGRFLRRANVDFNQTALSPVIAIEFDKEGAELFRQITKDNIGRPVAILFDGAVISAPTVREEIRDGRAEISGQFTLAEAKNLTRDLNLGALPVPIKLASTQVVGATLGQEAAERGMAAGVIGLIIVAVFMVFWYRLPGLVSVVSLAIYVALMLAIFKLLPVTLTAAGIAGFILSVGIAIDANILIFERLREELVGGKGLWDSIKEGFTRAWTSIRDSNLSSIISAVILFWFGTSLIKGFALTLAIGIGVSMFTAITVTRTFLLAVGFRRQTKVTNFLFKQAWFKF